MVDIDSAWGIVTREPVAPSRCDLVVQDPISMDWRSAPDRTRFPTE